MDLTKDDLHRIDRALMLHGASLATMMGEFRERYGECPAVGMLLEEQQAVMKTRKRIASQEVLLLLGI